MPLPSIDQVILLDRLRDAHLTGDASFFGRSLRTNGVSATILAIAAGIAVAFALLLLLVLGELCLD